MRDAHRLIAECPCRERLPVVRAVAQVRQPQRAAVQGGRARADGDDARPLRRYSPSVTATVAVPGGLGHHGVFTFPCKRKCGTSPAGSRPCRSAGRNPAPARDGRRRRQRRVRRRAGRRRARSAPRDRAQPARRRRRRARRRGRKPGAATTAWAARSCARSGWRLTRSCRARPRGSRSGLGAEAGAAGAGRAAPRGRQGDPRLRSAASGAGRPVRVRWAGPTRRAGQLRRPPRGRGPVRRYRARSGARRAMLACGSSRPAPPPPPPAPAPAPTPAPTPPAPTGDTAFPVAGPHDYGGADSGFGAGRAGHIHQGQDVAAAEGTPLVAPRAGHDHQGRLPGRRRRLLRGRGATPTAATVRVHAPRGGLDRRSPKASRSAAGQPLGGSRRDR